MPKSRVARFGLLAVLVAFVLAGVLVFPAIDTGSSASAAPGAQDQSQNQQTPWLGVYFVRASGGVTIAYVIADSPADTAGLQRGDVVTAVDGTAVETPQDFRDALDGKNVGDTATLSISRDGQALDVSVTLEAQPEALAPAVPLLPELEGIAADELFGHFQGGEFNYTDANGNAITVVVEPGTVASVDTTADTLTVNLNAGGTKTYTVEDTDLIGRGGTLSDLAEGDNVTVMTVNDDVRAVLLGGGLGFLPGLGCGRHGGGFGRGGPGGFENGGDSSFSVPDAASATGL